MDSQKTIMKFLSKAKTLKQLEGKLHSCEVLSQISFTVSDFYQNLDFILNEISSKFDVVIIRSSAANEDSQNASCAGEFLSIANINAKNVQECKSAIIRVIDSYNNQDLANEVLVQPMLENVSCSGVLFSCDPQTFAPYLIVNLDFSGKTDGVTSGGTNSLKTIVHFKTCKNIQDFYMQPLIKMTNELETLFKNSALDIEFAFCKDKLYLLQVRPLVKDKDSNFANLLLENSLEKVSKKIQKLSTKHPSLLGKKAIYGVMPDWNPAEIIGLRPKKLALTLYKELVTNSVWAYQRDNYGYRNLRSHPLLIDFLGVPYIDVRVSFNSFIPKKLDEDIAEKLANYYLEQLANFPHLHDKVEFEIVFSCYTLDLSQSLQKLKDFNFNDNELKRIEFALLSLTNSVINHGNGLYKKDLEKIEILKQRYENIVNSNLAIVDKIYWLIEECKRYGTLPFAGIARAAFMAMQFLNSFVSLNIITEEERHLFLNSLNTVSKQLGLDLILLFDGKISQEIFLQKYGHLRPGTYDITSTTYKKAFDLYFNTKPHVSNVCDFNFSKEQKSCISALLKENGIDSNFEELICFIKEAIEGREYAKFVFTKTLSKALDYIGEFGERLDISRNDIAHLSVQDILNLYSSVSSKDIKTLFEETIANNKREYQYTKSVKLPALIVNSEDIYSFEVIDNQPNFITLKSICTSVVSWSENISVSNKIVCIKSADPGYDFLFTKNIAGLITCYGGSNSHMAIRCAELGIPAIIGAGEKLFSNCINANTVEIDALAKVCRIVS